MHRKKINKLPGFATDSGDINFESVLPSWFQKYVATIPAPAFTNTELEQVINAPESCIELLEFMGKQKWSIGWEDIIAIVAFKSDTKIPYRTSMKNLINLMNVLQNTPLFTKQSLLLFLKSPKNLSLKQALELLSKHKELTQDDIDLFMQSNIPPKQLANYLITLLREEVVLTEESKQLLLKCEETKVDQLVSAICIQQRYDEKKRTGFTPCELEAAKTSTQNTPDVVAALIYIIENDYGVKDARSIVSFCTNPTDLYQSLRNLRANNLYERYGEKVLNLHVSSLVPEKTKIRTELAVALTQLSLRGLTKKYEKHLFDLVTSCKEIKTKLMPYIDAVVNIEMNGIDISDSSYESVLVNFPEELCAAFNILSKAKQLSAKSITLIFDLHIQNKLELSTAAKVAAIITPVLTEEVEAKLKKVVNFTTLLKDLTELKKQRKVNMKIVNTLLRSKELTVNPLPFQKAYNAINLPAPKSSLTSTAGTKRSITEVDASLFSNNVENTQTRQCSRNQEESDVAATLAGLAQGLI